MFPVYEEKNEESPYSSADLSPCFTHLHNSIEFIYITEGTLELGMGQELYHMEEGDVSGLDGQRSGHQQVRIVQSFFRNLSPEFQSVSQ